MRPYGGTWAETAKHGGFRWFTSAAYGDRSGADVLRCYPSERGAQGVDADYVSLRKTRPQGVENYPLLGENGRNQHHAVLRQGEIRSTAAARTSNGCPCLWVG